MPGRGLKKMTPDREWAKPKNSPPVAPADLVALAALVELPPSPPSPTPPPPPVVSAPPALSLNLQQILENDQAHIKNRNKQAIAPEIPPPGRDWNTVTSTSGCQGNLAFKIHELNYFSSRSFFIFFSLCFLYISVIM